MKKLVTIAIIMIVSLNVIKAQTGVCFGIKAGLNLEDIVGLNSGNGVVGITENNSSKMNFGFHAGVLARIGFDDHWALVPEVLYTTGGARTTVSQTYTILGATYTSNSTGTVSLSYIQVPIFVNYKFDFGGYLEAGPYMAFLIGTNKSTTNSNGTSISSTSDTSNNSMDLGVGAGVGYRFCMGLGFNLRYNYGLNMVYKQERSVNDAGIIYTQPSYGKNGVLQFSISYLFGCNGCTPKQPTAEIISTIPDKVVEAPVDKDVQFSVQAPNTIPIQHVVKETLPLCNYIFFNAGNTEIPDRYTLLTKDQALGFSEIQLQDCQKNPGTRSSRQLKIHYNTMNIVADRMKRFPASTIKLVGSSGGKGKDIGLANANAVKNYFVNVFGIDASRISVEGRNLPLIPSEIPNATRDQNLTIVEDNRVDIISTSPDLMTLVEGNSALCLKPVEVITYDNVVSTDNSPVSVNVGGASEALSSWSVEVVDSKGNVQNFGPYTSDVENIPASSILQDNQSGTYNIVLTGQTKSGHSIRKESTINLAREVDLNQPEQRFSILFEFDKSKTVATFQNFLTNTVATLIPSNSTVVINGYTDVVGDEAYNLNLSKQRALETQKILENAISKTNKTKIVYKTNGYGESNPLFQNSLPEERFYNRTVIIDIIPASTTAKL
jgi:outer membrane protein OmpA-like peptidoglycan-associated protein